MKNIYVNGSNGSQAINVDSLVKELQLKLQPKKFRKGSLVKHAQKMESIEVEDITNFYSDGRLNFLKNNQQ